MAANRLTMPLIVVTISLALILNVITLNWTGSAGVLGAAETTGSKILQTILGKPSEADEMIWPPTKDELEEGAKEAHFDCKSKRVKSLAKAIRDLPCTDDNIVIISHKYFDRCDSMIPSRYSYVLGCSQMIVDKMKMNVANLPLGHQRDGLELAKEFRATIWGKPMDYLDAYGSRDLRGALHYDHYKPPNALRDFLRKKEKVIMKQDSSVNNLPWAPLYQQHVVSPCKSWLSATDTMRKLYVYVKSPYYEEHDVKHNLGVADMCQYIFDHKASIQRKLGMRDERIDWD